MSAKKMLILLGGLLATLLAVQAAAAPTRMRSENLFYMVDTLNAFNSFKQHADDISIVVPAVYHIDRDGTVYGALDRRVLSIAKAHGVKVMPIIASFDQKGIHDFLNDAKAQARAIRIMLYDAQRYHYYGWQFDLENVHVTDGPAYTGFFARAAKALHAHGLKITMAVVKTSSPVPQPDRHGYDHFLYSDWRGAFDYPKLAHIADFLSFMSYDEHTSLTPPGPVAGLPWMRRMADYLLRLGVDPHKISFGIPTYSDYWYPTWSASRGARSTREEISYAEAENLLDRYQATTRWMADQGVDYARWSRPDGVFSWLFLEDARSFGDKLALIRAYHFRGFSAWVLGDEDPRIWPLIEQRTRTLHYH